MTQINYFTGSKQDGHGTCFIYHPLFLPQEDTISPLLNTVASGNEEKKGESIRERMKRFSEPAIHSSLASTMRPVMSVAASSGLPSAPASSGSPLGPASSGFLPGSGSPVRSGLPPARARSCSPPITDIRRQQHSLPAKLSEEVWSGAGSDRVAAAVQWVDKELRKASTTCCPSAITVLCSNVSISQHTHTYSLTS